MSKILIIDDEPAIRDVLKVFLEEQGFNVYIAGNGKEALTVFRTECPEVVFLDLLLPEKTGKDVLQEIRNLVPHTVVIIITGFSEDEIFSIIRPLDVQGILKKPFRLEHIEKKILPKIKKNLRPHWNM